MFTSESEQELEAKVAQAQSDEEIISIFAEAGIQVTLDQLTDDTETELEEDQLDAVSGGAIYYIVRKLINRYRSSSGRSHGGGGGHSFGGGRGGGGFR